MSLTRLVSFGRRRLAARRLNVPFARASGFAIPTSLRLAGRDVSLLLPDEHGVRVAFVELLLDDCYGLRSLAGSRSEDKIARVVDIGANVGLFGLAARVAFPQATIHCYEPNVVLESYIAHQANIARCYYFLEAVGHEAGRVNLDVNIAESVQTSSYADPNGVVPRVAFRMVLDRIGGSADLVKMDCEGAEWEILEDTESWRRVRFLSLEYHLGDGTDHDRIRSALAKLGYTIKRQTQAANYGLVSAGR
jgi:FkbM family methyltransferase